MRVTGIVLIILGILMVVFNGLNLQTEKKVLDLGPLEVNKKENRHIGWPVWAGGIAILGGIVLIIADRRK